MKRTNTQLLALAALVFPVALYGDAVVATPLRLDFGPGAPIEGRASADAGILYTPERGYGLISAEDIGAVPANNNSAFKTGALASGKPFFFAVDLPEGNYDVAVHLGDPAAASDTTVKVESRRLMLESVKTAKGEMATCTFTVNIHTPEIGGTDRQVSLKPREIGALHWDDKLTIEFNGPHPAVAGLEIKRNDSALTIYLAGDSTVTDQRNEPWASWGQILPRFFSAGTAIANYAESGLSLGTFKGGKRLEKILSTLKPGDYVFIQFGHNDMKEKRGGAFTTYADNLRFYVDTIVAKQGKPVLVTPMYRRRFSGGKLVDTLRDYPEAVRQVAKEKNVPCIDLHAMSARLFTALGESKTKAAFVHVAANTYPGQEKAIADNTHFSYYGAYELARCVIEGIRANVPELASRLAPDAGAYNPEKPANPAAFKIPSSPPSGDMRIPEGDGRKIPPNPSRKQPRL